MQQPDFNKTVKAMREQHPGLQERLDRYREQRVTYESRRDSLPQAPPPLPSYKSGVRAPRV